MEKLFTVTNWDVPEGQTVTEHAMYMFTCLSEDEKSPYDLAIGESTKGYPDDHCKTQGIICTITRTQ